MKIFPRYANIKPKRLKGLISLLLKGDHLLIKASLLNELLGQIYEKIMQVLRRKRNNDNELPYIQDSSWRYKFINDDQDYSIDNNISLFTTKSTIADAKFFKKINNAIIPKIKNEHKNKDFAEFGGFLSQLNNLINQE